MKDHTCLYGKECWCGAGPDTKMEQTGAAGWPRFSDSAGVHPSQIPQAMEEARQRGVRVEFRKDGAVKFDNYAHQKQYTKAIGLTDISKREITLPKGLRSKDPSLGRSRS